MTHIEQHKTILELREVEQKMSRDDYEVYAMFRKRDYDDEDLDKASKKKLTELYDKYMSMKGKQSKRNPLDDLFSKSSD